MSHDRKNGVFYTPKPFVDLAHEYIASVFGEDWKERYIVWDSCAGGLNLTKEYEFKELYISTLEQQDIDEAIIQNLNPGSLKFQFDFLNKQDHYIPQPLFDAIYNGKEILFFINPPYVNATTIKGIDLAGVGKTWIGDEMRKIKYNRASGQLAAQFMFRIMRWAGFNKNIHLLLFNSPVYMTGTSYDVFRRHFLNQFGFAKGFMFSAGHFNDTADYWAVTFSIWKNGLGGDRNDFIHDIYDLDKSKMPILLGQKTLYNLDGKETANDFYSKK